MIQRGPANCKIEAIEYYLPQKVITNEFLFQECGIDSEFLNNKIGITERRIAAPDESTSDMAFQAAEKLIQEHKIDRNEIGLLLVCTQNPDYRLPTSACVLQHRLKLKTSCIAFDINLGCSGFTYGLVIAGNFIETGAVKKAIIIMADTYSKIIDYKDKNTASLFGDAASAVFLSQTDPNSGLIDYNFGTDGSGAEYLILYNSGVVKQADKKNTLYMNGRKVFEFSLETVPVCVKELMKKNKLAIKDIKYFVFHQANQHMLKKIQKHLSIPDEKMFINMKYIGNTVSSSIPIALKDLRDKGDLHKGDLIIMVGFGVGLSWGAVLYKHV